MRRGLFTQSSRTKTTSSARHGGMSPGPDSEVDEMTAIEPVALPERALRYLGLNPDNPVTWVLAALAGKYDLDPLLKQIEVIPVKGGGVEPYITRDGYLHIA